MPGQQYTAQALTLTANMVATKHCTIQHCCTLHNTVMLHTTKHSTDAHYTTQHEYIVHNKALLHTTQHSIKQTIHKTGVQRMECINRSLALYWLALPVGYYID